MRITLTSILVLGIAQHLSAHPQPTTLALLDVSVDSVSMKLHLPLPELELAFGHNVSQKPEQSFPLWQQPFADYLLQHIHVDTPDGQQWSVKILDTTVDRDEVLAHLKLTPPPGAPVRNFTLKYGAILHQVVTHKAFVSLHSDWAAGKVETANLGVIAVNTATTLIEPLHVQLGEGSTWAGFSASLKLGMYHIREGLDHLLFLLLILVTAARCGDWRSLAKIVTAFTLGHSITLAAAAFNWLRVPQQPVEVIIALSILVTAVHAIRPIFPGRETYVVAGFGLIHGLAFATAISGLELTGTPLMLSILGFNLGIELIQLFVIAITLPWLYLLSRTPAYKPVQLAGASLAAIASIAWLANRISGQSNPIERLLTSLTDYAPIGILILAAIAIAAYFLNSLGARQSAWAGEGLSK